MPNSIISVSLNDRLFQEVSKLQGEMGFSGRSQLVMAGLKMLISEKASMGKLSGKAKGVLVITHGEKTESNITYCKHRFSDIIKTHMHTNMETAV